MDYNIDNDYDKAIDLREILTDRATGGGNTFEEDYHELRNYFLRNELLKNEVPSWLKKYRTLNEFWYFIRDSIEGYSNRRIFLINAFNPLLDFIEFPPLLKTEVANSKEQKVLEKEKIILPNNKVFIVHGHDREMELNVARFVEKLGLEAIILHEQASGGNTIIEKIEENTDVGYGIVLYSPCDIGKGKEEEILKDRARQNVVFEHGYLIGKLGRDCVIALNKNNVEVPSDITGIVYVPYDNHGGWRIAIAREMQNKGFEIDLKKLFL